MSRVTGKPDDDLAKLTELLSGITPGGMQEVVDGVGRLRANPAGPTREQRIAEFRRIRSQRRAMLSDPLLGSRHTRMMSSFADVKPRARRRQHVEEVLTPILARELQVPPLPAACSEFQRRRLTERACSYCSEEQDSDRPSVSEKTTFQVAAEFLL